MVDDEPAGRAEAPGPETGVVAVPGQDEQARPLGGRDDLALGPPPAFRRGAWPGQPPSRGGLDDFTSKS